ncbi:MAG: hypothetical protein IJI24_06390 [Lachnospiraceae bacterium]|nr:hypothetical protein [Lachnospiraceae bacterium]
MSELERKQMKPPKGPDGKRPPEPPKGPDGKPLPPPDGKKPIPPADIEKAPEEMFGKPMNT